MFLGKTLNNPTEQSVRLESLIGHRTQYKNTPAESADRVRKGAKVTSIVKTSYYTL